MMDWILFISSVTFLLFALCIFLGLKQKKQWYLICSWILCVSIFVGSIIASLSPHENNKTNTIPEITDPKETVHFLVLVRNTGRFLNKYYDELKNNVTNDLKGIFNQYAPDPDYRNILFASFQLKPPDDFNRGFIKPIQAGNWATARNKLREIERGEYAPFSVINQCGLKYLSDKISDTSSSFYTIVLSDEFMNTTDVLLRTELNDLSKAGVGGTPSIYDLFGKVNSVYQFIELKDIGKKYLFIFNLAPLETKSFSLFLKLPDSTYYEKNADSISIALNYTIDFGKINKEKYSLDRLRFVVYGKGNTDVPVQEQYADLNNRISNRQFKARFPDYGFNGYVVKITSDMIIQDGGVFGKYRVRLNHSVNLGEHYYYILLKTWLPIQNQLAEYINKLNSNPATAEFIFIVLFGILFVLSLIIGFYPFNIRIECEIDKNNNKPEINRTIGVNEDNKWITSVKLTPKVKWFKYKYLTTKLTVSLPDYSSMVNELKEKKIKLRKENLIFLFTGNDKKSNEMQVRVPAHGLDLNIEMQKNALEDLDIRPETLNKNCVREIPLTLTYEIKKITIPVKIIFFPDEKNQLIIKEVKIIKKEGYEHSIVKKSEEAGKLSLKTSSSYQYANEISGKISLKAEMDNADVTGAFSFSKDTISQEIQVTLPSLTTKEIPFYIHYDKISNPLEEKNIKISILIDDINKTDVILVLKPDTETTELSVTWEAHGVNNYKTISFDAIKDENINHTVTAPAKWGIIIDPLKPKYTRLLKVELKNKAKNPTPDGKVNINEVNISFELKKINNELIIRNESDIFRNYPNNSNHILQNGNSENIIYEFTLEDSKLLQFLKYYDNSRISVKFEFNFHSQQTLKGINKQGKISFKFDFLLHRLVESWLGIDFGTSAIAAGFYDAKETKLINLPKYHKEKLNRDDPKKLINEIDFPDHQTCYLYSLTYFPAIASNNPPSSNKYFPLDKIKFSKDGQEITKTVDFVDIAPDISTMKKYTIKRMHKAIIPYLKTLLGYNYVPLENHNIQYEINNMPCVNIPVDQILTCIYIRLIKDYILAYLKENYRDQYGEKQILKILGKIVISIPNTFTLSHKDLLYKLFDMEIRWNKLFSDSTYTIISNKEEPIFHKDNIKFISESNAVLVYYARTRKNNDDEKILIYDLGAGTLDITYGVITIKDNKLIVTEISKIGIKKAGNYLDTILSIIVYRIFLKNNVDIAPIFDTSKESAFHLKTAIRDFLKPFLGEIDNTFQNIYDDEMMASFKENLKFAIQDIKIAELNIEDFIKRIFNADEIKNILNDDLITTFINDITEDIFNKLKNITDNQYKDEKGKLIIDNYVLSGRMSQFHPIKKKLKSYLSENTTLGDKKPISLSINDLKESVIKGALFSTGSDIEFDEKEFNAYYGILYTTDFNQSTFKFEKMFVPGSLNNKFETEKTVDNINLSNTGSIDLVQSYTPEEIIQLYSEKNSDTMGYFTKITEISSSSITGSVVNASVKYNPTNKRFRLKAGNKETGEVYEAEINEDINYEMNTWPFNKMEKLKSYYVNKKK